MRRHVYIALNKPIGITCTTESAVKGNIIDFIDHQQRIFPIGRLDKDSEGLILLTSNGDIVNELLRSENHHEKEYLVGVNKAVTDEFLSGMARGVRVHGQMTQPCRTQRIARFGFRIVLTRDSPADPPDGRCIRHGSSSCVGCASSMSNWVHQARSVAELTDAELRGLLPNARNGDQRRLC